MNRLTSFALSVPVRAAQSVVIPVGGTIASRPTSRLACNTRSRYIRLSNTFISTSSKAQTQYSKVSNRKSSSSSRSNSEGGTPISTPTPTSTYPPQAPSQSPSPPPPPEPSSTSTSSYPPQSDTQSPSPTSSSPPSPSPSTDQQKMPPIPPILTLPIESYKSDTHTAPEGHITITQPYPKIYLLAFHQAPDNRLTPPFLRAFRLALDILLTTLPPGIVVTTSAIPKFYSNGLDYAGAVSDKNFMSHELFPLWRSLLTFPWPTVALINGHAFAGGLMTAMAHDYRIMNPHKGYLCLNELDFNAPLSPAMASLFKAKLSMTTFRTMVLEGKRFGALAAVEAGIVDGVGGLEEAVKVIKEIGLAGKLREVGVGSYGLIKEEMYREVITDLDLGTDGEVAWKEKKDNMREKALEKSKKAVEKWKEGGGKLADVKAKL